MPDITLPGAFSAAMKMADSVGNSTDVALGGSSGEEPVYHDQSRETGSVDPNRGITPDQHSYAQTLMTVMSAELAKPLAQRVYESNLPRHDVIGDTFGASLKGTGWKIATDSTMQMGGQGANIMLLPADQIIALWTAEIQCHGCVKIMPGQPHRTLDINTGPINASLIPPAGAPLPGELMTPALAVLTVPVQDLGQTNSVATNVKCAEPILPVDTIAMAEDAARINASTVAGVSTTTLDVRPAVPNIGVYVTIPDHIHTDASPAGVTGTVALWEGPNNVATAVQGLSYQYLFGYNRLGSQLEQSIADFAAAGGL